MMRETPRSYMPLEALSSDTQDDDGQAKVELTCDKP